MIKESDSEGRRPIAGRKPRRRPMYNGQYSEGGFRQFATMTTLIAGPPGSGKTTYVRSRAGVNDLVVDLDTLYAALSGHARYEKPDALLPFACEARDAVENRLLSVSDVDRAWIIKCAPKRADRDYYVRRGAAMVVLDVPAEECLRRIASDPERLNEPWELLIRQWWSEYEPE